MVGAHDLPVMDSSEYTKSLSVCLSSDNYNKSFFLASADPYASVTLGATKIRTQVIKNTLEPNWDEEMCFFFHTTDDVLQIFVKDWDRFSRNEDIGVVSWKVFHSLLSARLHVLNYSDNVAYLGC